MKRFEMLGPALNSLVFGQNPPGVHSGSPGQGLIGATQRLIQTVTEGRVIGLLKGPITKSALHNFLCFHFLLNFHIICYLVYYFYLQPIMMKEKITFPQEDLYLAF